MFDLHSIAAFIVSVSVALLVGRFIAYILRRLVNAIGRKADQSEDLGTVNRLRHWETYLILSSALIRLLLVLFAIYFWWQYVHPTGRPTALIGASALAVILLSGVLGPVLRDMAAGSFMMAEHWYGIGDYIKILGTEATEGVVERVTLRSTRLRSMNGEIVWVNNQNIAGIKLTPRGIRRLGLEMFVNNPEGGAKLIEKANRRLPTGELLIITPLTIVSCEKVGDELWHITAVAETAPGREWLIVDSAVSLIKELDEKARTHVLVNGPLARDADTEAEKRFRRTIENARKRPTPKKVRIKPLVKKPAGNNKSV